MARSRMIEVGDVNAALEGYVPEESFLGGWMLATSLPPATSIQQMFATQASTTDLSCPRTA